MPNSPNSRLLPRLFRHSASAAGSAGGFQRRHFKATLRSHRGTTRKPPAEPGAAGIKRCRNASRRSSDALEAFIPYLPWLWLIGTPLTFVLLVSGVVGTRRLGRTSRPDRRRSDRRTACAPRASLRISRRVTVAVCDRIASPVLIGIVRPMILLPPAAITGWSPDEIEMVLLHELAHVRRWDNLVNLLQRCLESLLFFHPAVWFVSVGFATNAKPAATPRSSRAPIGPMRMPNCSSRSRPNFRAACCFTRRHPLPWPPARCAPASAAS